MLVVRGTRTALCVCTPSCKTIGTSLFTLVYLVLVPSPHVESSLEVSAATADLVHRRRARRPTASPVAKASRAQTTSRGQCPPPAHHTPPHITSQQGDAFLDHVIIHVRGGMLSPVLHPRRPNHTVVPKAEAATAASRSTAKNSYPWVRPRAGAAAAAATST